MKISSCLLLLLLIIIGCENESIKSELDRPFEASSLTSEFSDKHVLVIGIDGFRGDALEAAVAANRVPAFKSLIDNGTATYRARATDFKADAGVLWNNGKIYFFFGKKYSRYDVANEEVDTAYPYPLDVNNTNWPGLESIFNTYGKVDAVVNWGNGKAYFFFGTQYVRYDMTNFSVDPGYPLSVNNANWPGLQSIFSTYGGVDAVINWGNGKAYFFFGQEYIRYDVSTFTVDSGYPRPVNSTNWPGLESLFDKYGKVDLVTTYGNGKAYFMFGDEYVRYNMSTFAVDTGYPLPVNNENWPGLPNRSAGQMLVSSVSWSGIHTGVWDDKHQITGNFVDDGGGENSAPAYPIFFERIKTAAPAAYLVSICNWDRIPTYIVQSTATDLSPVGGSSFERDSLVKESAKNEIQKVSPPDVMFLHFLGLDFPVGHNIGYGDDVPCYQEYIRKLDSYVGEILDEIELKTNEEWLIIVVSDHGGISDGSPPGGKHGVDSVQTDAEIHVPLIVSGPSSSQEGIVNRKVGNIAVPATIFHFLGISVNPAWNLDDEEGFGL